MIKSATTEKEKKKWSRGIGADMANLLDILLDTKVNG